MIRFHWFSGTPLGHKVSAATTASVDAAGEAM